MFCYGSGVIDGAREVPSLVPRSGISGSAGKKSRPLSACPVCGVPVRRLERHLNKCHNGQSNVPPPVATSVRTISAVPTVPSVRPVLKSPGAMCAVVVRHSDNPRQGLTRCSHCGARLLEKNLERHLNRVHRVMKTTVRSSPLYDSDRPESRKTVVPPDQLKNEMLQERLNRAMDATRGYAHSFREHGRFGSHPSHDDYDEGNP
jgi:hypothetical protein